MRNIWVRIGLTAGALFGVGILIVSGVRAGREKIHQFVDSSDDFPIPLFGIIPFRLGEDRLGDLRRITLLRDSPQHVTGVRVDVRLADSATLDILKDCRYLTVGDPLHVNEHTQFSCLADTSGFASFGHVEIERRQGGEPTTFERTLVFPPEVMRQIEAEMRSGRNRDSSKAIELRRLSDSLEGIGDSIRNRTRVSVEAAGSHGRRGSHSAPTQEVPPPAPHAPTAPKP